MPLRGLVAFGECVVQVSNGGCGTTMTKAEVCTSCLCVLERTQRCVETYCLGYHPLVA